MKYGYINITRGNNVCDFYLEGRYWDGNDNKYLHWQGYSGYTVREAVRLFKKEHGLTGKHNIRIDDYRR